MILLNIFLHFFYVFLPTFSRLSVYLFDFLVIDFIVASFFVEFVLKSNRKITISYVSSRNVGQSKWYKLFSLPSKICEELSAASKLENERRSRYRFAILKSWKRTVLQRFFTSKSVVFVFLLWRITTKAMGILRVAGGFAVAKRQSESGRNDCKLHVSQQVTIGACYGVVICF